MKLRLSLFAFAAASLFALPAWADKIAVLPFSSPNNVPRPELEETRKWTREAVVKKGHTYATPDEMVSAEAAVRDGVPDTSSEYIAAGNAVHAPWTIAARVQREDVPPSTLPSGAIEEGYTIYRIELEACQVATGRVESLSREMLPGDTDALADMIALLIRPEGISNADIPWERAGVPRPKPKPKAPPPLPPPPPPPPPEPQAPAAPLAPRRVYGAGHPLAIGASIGGSAAVIEPSGARGSSAALPIGAIVGYALPDDAPGLEFRASFIGQAAGPGAYLLDAGARYAIPIMRGVPLWIGPELLLGVHIASGAEKTGRFLTDGAFFVAYGITDNLHVEVAGDFAIAAGGSGTLGLAGGTARFTVRF